MYSFKKTAQKFYHTVKNDNKFLSLTVVLILALTIPPTLSISQKFLDIRQHADTSTAVISVNPVTTKPGTTLTVGWTIDQTTTTTVTGAETLQLWKTAVEAGRPAQEVGAQIYLNCAAKYNGVDITIPPHGSLYIGTCSFSVPADAPIGMYVIRMLASDGSTILGTSPQITIAADDTQGTPFPKPPVETSISAFPNPCMLTDYGTCSSMIFWNVPNATDAASVTVKVKGINNSLFANAPFGIKKAGWITAGGATFELYIGSSATPVSSVSVKGIDRISAPVSPEEKPALQQVNPDNSH